MEELVLQALQQQDWDPEAARRWLLNNLGDKTPGLEQFQQQCAVAAKAYWRQIVQEKGVDYVAANEAEARGLMGALGSHLSAEDAADVIREERYRHQIRNPKQFKGWEPKKD
jgi:hypothetical protein